MRYRNNIDYYLTFVEQNEYEFTKRLMQCIFDRERERISFVVSSLTPSGHNQVLSGLKQKKNYKNKKKK